MMAPNPPTINKGANGGAYVRGRRIDAATAHRSGAANQIILEEGYRRIVRRLKDKLKEQLGLSHIYRRPINRGPT